MEHVHSDDLSLRDLGNFHGTEHYYKNYLDVTSTDGINYIMENGYSWFVTDAISVLKVHPNVKGQEFVTVKLNLLPDNNAEMVMTDGNDHVLYRQKYEYTNAKRPLTLFYTNDVLMLSGEY